MDKIKNSILVLCRGFAALCFFFFVMTAGGSIPLLTVYFFDLDYDPLVVSFYVIGWFIVAITGSDD